MCLQGSIWDLLVLRRASLWKGKNTNEKKPKDARCSASHAPLFVVQDEGFEVIPSTLALPYLPIFETPLYLLRPNGSILLSEMPSAVVSPFRASLSLHPSPWLFFHPIPSSSILIYYVVSRVTKQMTGRHYCFNPVVCKNAGYVLQLHSFLSHWLLKFRFKRAHVDARRD